VENIQLVREQAEKNRIFASKIRSAMIYPAIIFFVMIVVGMGTAWFILPKLAQTFASLRIDLPVLTQTLISFGVFVADYGHIFSPLSFFGVLLLVYFIFFFPSTRVIG